MVVDRSMAEMMLVASPTTSALVHDKHDESQ